LSQYPNAVNPKKRVFRFSYVPSLRRESLEKYLSELYGQPVRVVGFGELGKVVGKAEEELKGFGYGRPYVIEFEVGGERLRAVLETVKPGPFGHEHFSDRAKILLWQHEAFNKLPRHVRSIDVGAFTESGGLKSLGDCREFFILVEYVEGREYHFDLDRIRDTGVMEPLDLERCKALAKYLAEIHSVKLDNPGLYVRRIRELVGHGECIMGLTDSYPEGLEYAPWSFLEEVEKMCVEWRWRLKRKTYRLSQVHGDFHPWNVLFREGTDFTVLDRSRGEWGEPADDVTSMTINYIFYSLQAYGRLEGPFEKLFKTFWNTYIDQTGDEEMLEVVQPFYAWRGLVVASPVWYPNLPRDVRVKLFNFIKNVLRTERFDLDGVNELLGG